jgi:multiple sugar transport system permease protein
MAQTALSRDEPRISAHFSLRRLDLTWGMFFLAPWVIGFIFLTAFPMLASLYISFTEYNPVAGEAPHWIGAGNYERAFGLEFKTLDDPEQLSSTVLSRGYSELARINNIVIGARDPLFWKSLRVTIAFASISLPTSMVVSLLLALLVNANVPLVKLFRTLYYIPVMVPAVAGAVILQQIINRDVGWLNDLLQLVGLGRPDWNNDERLVLIGLTIIGLWGAGSGMIIYLAGIQGIPTELYEAAKVDGANAVRRFWHITIPMLTPVILYNLIIGLIGTFQYFTTAYILSDGTGGPNYSRYFYNMHLTRTAFSNLEMGYASALAWILLVIIVAITVVVFATSKSWVFYAGARRS